MFALIPWSSVALRLVLTMVAGGLLGIERSKTGHVAGLRTTLLVTLAASVAMIQMNLLMGTNGKPADSYVVMDLMRLPLGILTGVGFIGAGAIIHREDLVLGVTTAATLWLATVVGLCLGGGQLILGSVATLLGVVVLWWFGWLESQTKRGRKAQILVELSTDQITAEDLCLQLCSKELRIDAVSTTHNISGRSRKIEAQVEWMPASKNEEIPGVLSTIERLPGVIEVQWRGAGSNLS